MPLVSGIHARGVSDAPISSNVASKRAFERLLKLEHADIAGVENVTQVGRCVP